eukprot:3337494-Rhodomonas_salina.1
MVLGTLRIATEAHTEAWCGVTLRDRRGADGGNEVTYAAVGCAIARTVGFCRACLLYTSDAADDM